MPIRHIELTGIRMRHELHGVIFRLVGKYTFLPRVNALVSGMWDTRQCVHAIKTLVTIKMSRLDMQSTITAQG